MTADVNEAMLEQLEKLEVSFNSIEAGIKRKDAKIAQLQEHLDVARRITESDSRLIESGNRRHSKEVGTLLAEIEALKPDAARWQAWSVAMIALGTNKDETPGLFAIMEKHFSNPAGPLSVAELNAATDYAISQQESAHES